MKKNGSVIFVVCVFAALAAYRLRSAPVAMVVAMTPIFALALFLICANPDNPDSWTVRFLKWTGFYIVIQDAHSRSLEGPMITRILIVFAMIGWFLGVMKYWPK
jgi:hypothetical protein